LKFRSQSIEVQRFEVSKVRAFIKDFNVEVLNLSPFLMKTFK